MIRQLHFALLYLLVAMLFQPPDPALREGRTQPPEEWVCIEASWPSAEDPRHREARRREVLYWLAHLRYSMADPEAGYTAWVVRPEEAHEYLRHQLAALERGERAPVEHPILTGVERRVEELLRRGEARLEELRRDPESGESLAAGWMGHPEVRERELEDALVEVRRYLARF